MKILFLNSLGKTQWGGGEKWMLISGKGLASRGHQVTIACIKGSIIEQKSKDIGLNTWNYSIPADIAFWKEAPLKTYLKRYKIDVLICCQNKDVKIGAKAARKIGSKAIFARQGIQNLTNKKKYIKPFSIYIDGIIANTLSIKNIYEAFGWFPENFIHVIYNGVEIPVNTESVNLHELYMLPDKSKTIFSAGRLDPQKGFDLLIDVAVKAKKQNLNWQFIIAGEGKTKDQLKSIAEKKGVSDLMHFIGFSYDIQTLLKSSDIFVLPSRYEGMPNALLEAMAMGKASVATRVNGAPELIEDGISGFLVESENVDQLFQKLELLLTDNSLRISMGQKALSRVKNHFTINKMIDKLEALLLKQISKTN